MSAIDVYDEELFAQVSKYGRSNEVVRHWIDGLSVQHQPTCLAEVLCDTLHDIEVNTHFILIDIFGLMPDASADAIRLQQVLTHVLQAAMANSPVDSTIRLTTFYSTEFVGLTFNIEAGGENLELDFDLLVARCLTEAMEGHINVGRAPGFGTNIEVSLIRW
jgi:hypothetical protein